MSNPSPTPDPSNPNYAEAAGPANGEPTTSIVITTEIAPTPTAKPRYGAALPKAGTEDGTYNPPLHAVVTDEAFDQVPKEDHYEKKEIAEIRALQKKANAKKHP
ncbi:hypothetical protein IAQ61_006323 [Plenodomus lingam]|uniref:Predicted protein n=1 Tax=Leptosphaeria maculans (strain JN3 / isolate v23.1.3 / race Av1-4-5-6-7-8) TaxID=985895 RepID=E4ZSD8_LEPMJ|nr:predicted protein [Plenodomus lingam JN3]KAH9869118.1 hypothetical protein IAQ61_006323 [Plenodomus lingam]CBX94318.1 predicted protein [Plenodomus lingam JN3]